MSTTTTVDYKSILLGGYQDLPIHCSYCGVDKLELVGVSTVKDRFWLCCDNCDWCSPELTKEQVDKVIQSGEVPKEW